MTSHLPDNERWFALDINPEPWAVGPLDLIRRGGKLAPTMGRNQQLHMYQQAVKEELAEKYAEVGAAPFPPGYTLSFFFWRDTQKGNYADATNLMKATEDALQGVLLTNDREVIRNYSEIVQQGPGVHGKVVFCIRWGVKREGLYWPMPLEIPEEILTEVALFQTRRAASNNAWPPK